ncbi:MAG: HigA family addiction module antitoxin [Phycisphaerae bacterium]
MDSSESQLFSNNFPSPGEVLRQMLETKGWTQDDLAVITGRSRSQINDVVCGRAAITSEMAVALASAFGNEAAFWINLDTAARLARVIEDRSGIARRAEVFDIAPVKEMQRRGWISTSKDTDELRNELEHFFDVKSLDELKSHPYSMRKTDSMEDLSPPQRAWCYRVRQLAKLQMVAEYDAARLPACEQHLRRLAANPEDTCKVPKVLAQYGIRFIIVEPLQSSKVDGVAFWLDEKSPVIGMSVRFDRVDSFWFTLCHELSHIRHRDESPLDSDLTDNADAMMVVRSEMERRADAESAATLVSPEEMNSFIMRVGPLYSKDRVVRFASRIRIHPGVIVGQLQHRREIGYSALREYLTKVRHFVLPAAIVDGWGRAIDARRCS